MGGYFACHEYIGLAARLASWACVFRGPHHHTQQTHVRKPSIMGTSGEERIDCLPEKNNLSVLLKASSDDMELVGRA
jgi:hypothetical protein